MLSIFRVIIKLSSSRPQFDFICFVSVIESNTQFVLQGKQIKPIKVDRVSEPINYRAKNKHSD